MSSLHTILRLKWYQKAKWFHNLFCEYRIADGVTSLVSFFQILNYLCANKCAVIVRRVHIMLIIIFCGTSNSWNSQSQWKSRLESLLLTWVPVADLSLSTRLGSKWLESCYIVQVKVKWYSTKSSQFGFQFESSKLMHKCDSRQRQWLDLLQHWRYFH